MTPTIPTTSSPPIDRRYDFVLLFDVQDGNPNGDPDAGNMPRIDPQSLQGLVTDGCIKRKIRNAIAVLGEDRPGMELYFQTQDAAYERRILNDQHQRAFTALNLDSKPRKGDGGKEKADATTQARRWMCQNFYDIRAFGAVMTTGVNCGQVRGPVQITFSRSIDPILPLDFAITRKSVTKPEEAQKQAEEKGSITGTMGRKNTVPYGLYRCHGFVNAYLARDTGFQPDADLRTAVAGALGRDVGHRPLGEPGADGHARAVRLRALLHARQRPGPRTVRPYRRGQAGRRGRAAELRRLPQSDHRSGGGTAPGVTLHRKVG